MKQTAVDWLLQELEKVNYHPTEAMIMYAKKLEKQQIIDAHFDGYESISGQAEQYYNETYGSKGSDEINKAEEMGLYDKIELENPNDNIFTSSQTEISDEEIERIGESYRIFYNGKEGNGNLVYKHYIQGIKWYREQLKKKQ